MRDASLIPLRQRLTSHETAEKLLISKHYSLFRPHPSQPPLHVRREPATSRETARTPAAPYDGGLRPSRRRASRRGGGKGWKNHFGIHEEIIAKGNNQIDITRLNVKYRFDTDCLTDKKATQVHFYPRLHCGK